jgi:hypothetical protein
MHWKRRIALAVAAAGAATLAGTTYLTHGLLDSLLVVAVVATLSGLYLLRRYARAALVYNRDPEPEPDDRDAGTTTATPARTPTLAGAEPSGTTPDASDAVTQWRVRDVMSAHVYTVGRGHPRRGDTADPAFRTLMIPAGARLASVNDGVVALTGRTEHRGTVAQAEGVAGVVDRLTFDTDDTAPTATAQHDTSTLRHGWLVVSALR